MIPGGPAGGREQVWKPDWTTWLDAVRGGTADERLAELATLSVEHFPMLEGLRPAW